jgi:hypothetical protein
MRVIGVDDPLAVPGMRRGISDQSGTWGSRDFTTAANPKCPAITIVPASRIRPWESGVEHADDAHEKNHTEDERHGTLT